LSSLYAGRLNRPGRHHRVEENNAMTMSTQKAFVNILLVYLLLFVSGSWRYNLSPDKLLIVGFLIALGAWLLFSDRKISEGFLLYIVIFSGFLVALSLYTGGSLSLTSAISATMKVVLAYLIIRTVGDHFGDVYVKVVVFLAIVSVLGYISDTFNLFDGIVRKLPRVGAMGFEGFLYVFRFPWHIDRNNSIFFEPGAYQAFLNAALFLLFFGQTSFEARKKLVYTAVLITTLITTFSTTGFLIFAIMLAMFLYRSELLSTAGKIKVVVAIMVVVAIFASQFYSTVVVKVEDYLTAGEYEFSYSAQSRSAQAKADLKIFKEHVFGLGQKDYMKEFGEAGRLDMSENGASSNGVTRTLAMYGLPFSLFIFGSYYWAFKRLIGDAPLTVAAFVMFMMFLAGESYYIASPISFALIASAFIFRRVSPTETARGTLNREAG